MAEVKNLIVAIKHCSAGNETVGDMWKETGIFDIDEPIRNIIEWAEAIIIDGKYRYIRNTIELTIPKSRIKGK